MVGLEEGDEERERLGRSMTCSTPVRRARAAWAVSALVLGLLAATPVAGQRILPVSTPSSKPAEADDAKSAAPVAPTPIPLAQIATESEALQPWLRQADVRLQSDPQIVFIQERLDGARDRLQVEVNEARVRLTENPSIDMLVDMSREWRGRNERITRIRTLLTRRATDLDALLQDISERETLWRITLQAASENRVPSDVLETIRSNDASLVSLAERTTRRRGEILSLGNQVSRGGTSVESLISEIQVSADLARGRLLQRDRPPIWSAFRHLVVDGHSLPDQMSTEVSQDAGVMKDYFAEDSRSLVWMVLIFVSTLPLAFGLRLYVRQRLAAGQELQGTVKVFARPVSLALLTALLAANLLLANAPSLAANLLGLLSLVPIVRLLLPVLPATVQPALLVVGGFYVLDRLRLLVDHVTLVDRGLLLLEAAVAVGLAVALLRSRRWREILASLRYGWLARRAIQTGLGLLVVALTANLIGYVAFARLLVGGILEALVIGIVVYAIDRVATTGLLILLSTSWARRSGVVRAAAPQIVLLGERVIRVLLALLAGQELLRAFLLDRWVLDGLSTFVFTPLEIGTLSIALGDLLVFGATVLASLWASRFVRFALQEEVFSRVRLRRGIPNAISSTASYTILLGGFFLALSAAGIDLSRFTVLAGAFGVGIGFGLQNVVNNFVSGLILIYERPVQAGDVVEIGPVLGTINRIGIRSSTVRTFEGAEVIVPNANLISEQVVNWTLSDRERRIEVPVGVAYGSDHVRVHEVLRSALDDAPDVLSYPQPEVLFRGLGESSLDFQVRFWTVQNNFRRVQSDVLGRIYTALAAAGIEIPFPQRDLHLRSVDATAAVTLSPPGSSDGATGIPSAEE